MRWVVLSRKGVDATAGGFPSPVLDDGRICPVPIPEPGSGTRIADLRAPGGRPLAAVVAGLGVRRVRVPGAGWRPLAEDLEVHADPDLDPATRPRVAGWRPLLGQAGAAQSHLGRTCGVGAGDLFLFWGWYRHAGEPRPQGEPGPRGEPGSRGDPRRGLHALYGWLEVGAVLAVRDGSEVPEAADHPHLALPRRPGNTVYLAAEHSTLVPGLPGAGLLSWDPALRLTAPGAARRSDWLLPAALAPAATGRPMTYHADPRRWTPVPGGIRLAAQHRGQEFVLPATPGVRAWAASVLRSGTRR